MTMLRDEQGQWSAARTFLLAWLIHCILLIWFRMDRLSPLLLTFHAGVVTPLIMWAAGPRIAKYMVPVGQALVTSLPKAPWRKERDVELGIDPSTE
jgi:hypothetical protein